MNEGDPWVQLMKTFVSDKILSHLIAPVLSINRSVDVNGPFSLSLCFLIKLETAVLSWSYNGANGYIYTYW